MRNGRVEALQSQLETLGAATFLVSAPVNVEYLTGFKSSNAAVLVRRDRVVLFTDGRYIEAARSLDGYEVLEADRELAGWLGARLGELAEPPVAFESNRLTYAAYESLAASGAELRPAAGVVERLRAVKDDDELDAIRRAAAVTAHAYDVVAEENFTGRTEGELAAWIERTLRDEGAEALAFPVIVASGPNAAVPHHHPGDRTIRPNETVIVDAGAVLDGYASDCTRTFATGPLPDDLAAAYELCLRTQEKALAAVSPGVDCSSLDALARDDIDAAGHPVMHGLGHGVGLELPELPVLRPTASGALSARHVVTIEPGVYLPGRGGVRIEDLVIVSDDGPEVLTPFTKNLVTLH
jgi:Xaa-Pro aminopeptidase